MKHKIFWKLFFILSTGLVTFFYLVHTITLKTEEKMSFIKAEHRAELSAWGEKAESYYVQKDFVRLEKYLQDIEQQENVWVSVVAFKAEQFAGKPYDKDIVGYYHFGRSIDWKIHLYFSDNPIMELPFQEYGASFLIRLPERMRPGTHWLTTKFALQIVIPMALLILLTFILYRHIITPLHRLDNATLAFSKGDLSVRVGQHFAKRDDELSHLANTFDSMASRIGELIENQRQLIADLSHELRTPLTRLDIAVENFDSSNSSQHLERISRESKQIRKLVENTLTFAWLENEQPKIMQEQVELVDLLDVLIEDARFEFACKFIESELSNSAMITDSSHKALCPAIENVLRNALKYTPCKETVSVRLTQQQDHYLLEINDSGPGIPEHLLDKIFEPFFRVDDSRMAESDSFGLGLALAKRHLLSVGANIYALNQKSGGLSVKITIPKLQM